MSLLRRLLPTSRAALALWAWKNRESLRDWGGFAVRSVPRLTAGETSDVVAEARLRVALGRDSRTRGADVEVEVHDGVAVLAGQVDPDTHLAVLAVAERARGVRRVHDRLQDRSEGRRRSPRRS